MQVTAGEFSVGDVIIGQDKSATATIVSIDTSSALPAGKFVIKALSCPSNNCGTDPFNDNEVIKSGTISAIYTDLTAPLGYRYRDQIYKPRCFLFKNDGKTTATYDGAQKFAQMAMATDPNPAQIKRPTSLVAYLMEAGKVPYEGTAAATTGGVLATEVHLPGIGMMGVGDISYDLMKDSSKGETAWTYLWDVDSMSYPVQSQNIVGASNKLGKSMDTDCTLDTECTLDTVQYGYKIESSLKPGTMMTATYDEINSGILYGAAAFTISNFVVREITIRNYTVAEFWGAVGGLWSASLMVCMVFFSTTEIADAKHRLFRVFNFTCPANRDEWMAEAEKEVANAAEEEANDKFREIYLAMKAAEAEQTGR